MCKAISAVAVCVSVVAIIRIIIILEALRHILPRRYGISMERQLYMQSFWLALAIAAVAIIVSICVYKLGSAIETETAYLSREILELNRKIDTKQKEMVLLQQKINSVTEEAHP